MSTDINTLKNQLQNERRLREAVENDLRTARKEVVRLSKSVNEVEFIIFRIPRTKWLYCKSTRDKVKHAFYKVYYKTKQLIYDIKELVWPADPVADPAEHVQ